MLVRKLNNTCALLCCAALTMSAGMASTAYGGILSRALCGKCGQKTSRCKESKCKSAKASREVCEGRALTDLPPNAVEGECYAKVFIQAQYKTVTERVMVKEAYETIEIIPAEYKWVEERVMVKDCFKQLEHVPAEYKWQERTVQVKPGHRGWVLEKTARCSTDDSKEIRDIYCLVSTPPEYKTIRIQCLAKPACVREVTIPAEYQTIRRQVVACPAKTKKVCHAAEFEDIEKTVLLCDAGMKWERVVCKEKTTAETANKIKNALAAAGYKPGPLNGELTSADWTALTQFQQKNGIGVGELSYETLKKLGIQVQ